MTYSIVEIPETADADLANEEEEQRNENRKEGSRPYGDDLLAHRVRELGIDNFAVPKADGKGARRRRIRKIDLVCPCQLKFPRRRIRLVGEAYSESDCT